MEPTLDDLLEGRIRFRRAWISRYAPKRRTVAQRALQAEIDYDEEHNFARMGAEFIDDDWLVRVIARADTEERKARAKRKKMERWAA